MSRADIREYVADALSLVAPNVHQSRGHTVSGAKLPFLNVYIPRETAQQIGLNKLQRIARMHVEYAAEGSADEIETLLDEAASEIETILFADRKLGGMVSRLDLTETESSISTDDGSSKPLGYIQLVFDVEYHTGTGQ